MSRNWSPLTDLALSRNTVRRRVRGEQPELHRLRLHSLDPWRAVLERRPVSLAGISPRDRYAMAEGCRNGARLWRNQSDSTDQQTSQPCDLLLGPRLIRPGVWPGCSPLT